MKCIECKKNKITKHFKLSICCSCYSKNWRKNHPEKFSYAYNGQKEKILKRDNHKCKLCGTKKRLEIHHFDKDRKNNLSFNLITVCIHCHAKIHKGSNKINKWSRKYEECIKCKTSKFKHASKGLCRKCYEIEYNINKNRKQYKKEWYQKRGKHLEKLRKIINTNKGVDKI